MMDVYSGVIRTTRGKNGYATPRQLIFGVTGKSRDISAFELRVQQMSIPSLTLGINPAEVGTLAHIPTELNLPLSTALCVLAHRRKAAVAVKLLLRFCNNSSADPVLGRR